MKKILFFTLLVFYYPSILLAQSTEAIKADELLDMYRTWVKALLFLIVVLSVALLILFVKYAKLKQNKKECCK